LTSQTSWVIFDYVGCFEDSLNGAGFHIELIVAEAIFAAATIMLASNLGSGQRML
jgi:hypothetical protein